MEKKYLTLQEAAQYLGISENTLKALTTKGDVEVYKPTNKLMYYSLDQIEAFITGRCTDNNAIDQSVNGDKPTGISKTIDPIKVNNRGKSVHQYSKSGEYIKTFKSCNEAAQQIGCHGTAISNCCNGKVKSSGGYQWKYSEE